MESVGGSGPSRDDGGASIPSHFRPLSCLKSFLKRLRGSPVETDLSAYWKMVEAVNAVDFSRQTDAGLAVQAGKISAYFRALSTNQSPGERAPVHGPPATYAVNPLSPAEVELFALVREAARRSLKVDPFDVQIMAGLAMARGCIAELPTGEGKTLAAVFPACLHALSGNGVHVVTHNDYLARRDAAWMQPVYTRLGLSLGCIQEGMIPAEKRAAYACDVTYGSAKEVGFDFLRDQIAFDRQALVHRPFNFAIVDEADSILIDEARIPLVISGAESSTAGNAHRFAHLVKTLAPGRDFQTDTEHRNVFLTEAGIEQVEALLGCGSLYDASNQNLQESLYCALHALALVRRDIDYIVRGGKIEIVDEFTGRVVDNRHWPNGLQAAVEAKEGLARKTEGRILGYITLQHFFRLYPALSGMTATALPAAAELHDFYGLKVVAIPPHIPSIREDHPEVLFTHREAKRRAIVQEIRQANVAGRPILVGTSSVKESEELAANLQSGGIQCAVLNARNDELEASIIAKAGVPGAVTISTNMAGRGVDIKLGGQDENERDAVVARGGLYVIGTNLHESFRVDCQLAGRAARQGDPGATRFFVSLGDDLFQHYGLTQTIFARHGLRHQDEPLASETIADEIAHAQRVIEGRNLDIRRLLFKYSIILEIQREMIQQQREEALFADDVFAREAELSPPKTGRTSDESKLPESPSVDVAPKSGLSPALLEKGLQRFGSDGMAELERRATLFHLDREWSDHLAWVQDTRDSIHLVSLGGREPLDVFRRSVTTEFFTMQKRVTAAIDEELRTIIEKNAPIEVELERLRAPASTWTYLVEENPFGMGVEMLKGKNLAFSAAALVYGNLSVLGLILSRLFRKKRAI